MCVCAHACARMRVCACVCARLYHIHMKTSVRPMHLWCGRLGPPAATEMGQQQSAHHTLHGSRSALPQAPLPSWPNSCSNTCSPGKRHPRCTCMLCTVMTGLASVNPNARLLEPQNCSSTGVTNLTQTPGPPL